MPETDEQAMTDEDTVDSQHPDHGGGGASDPGIDESTQEGKEAPAEAPETLETRLADTQERLLRTRAEFDNYRKRIQREFADIRLQTKLATIHEFLTVFDHFQMALAHASDDTESSSLRQGMELIQAEFSRTLEGLGLTTLNTVGQPFDPILHEAIAQEGSTEIPEGHVLRQWKAGFQLGDRLVRPATVVVSAGPPAAVSEEEA